MRNHLSNLLLSKSGRRYFFIFNNETVMDIPLKKSNENDHYSFMTNKKRSFTDETQTEKFTCKDENYEKN